MPQTTTGYAPDFLPVILPLPSFGPDREVSSLPYIHFTVLQDPLRRLPAATGVNINGATLRDIERGDDWHLDPRIPASEQAGPEIYANNDLDRGHQVRRRDPVWGDLPTATAANQSTFVYTNCAPQAGDFNQSAELWGGLENHVLEYARVYAQRISVFTGPVLDPDDPAYRGIQIPRLFWKIAAWTEQDDDGAFRLGSAGFLLDQTPELDGIDLRTAQAIAVGNPPPLGPFKTFQVPVLRIADLTGLDLDELIAADRELVSDRRGLQPSTGLGRELFTLEDVDLGTPRKDGEPAP